MMPLNQFLITQMRKITAKLICFSAGLLKEAISKPELKIKTWRVMPRPNNSIHKSYMSIIKDDRRQ